MRTSQGLSDLTSDDQLPAPIPSELVHSAHHLWSHLQHFVAGLHSLGLHSPLHPTSNTTQQNASTPHAVHEATQQHSNSTPGTQGSIKKLVADAMRFFQKNM